jgi:hypothetical protein
MLKILFMVEYVSVVRRFSYVYVVVVWYKNFCSHQIVVGMELKLHKKFIPKEAEPGCRLFLVKISSQLEKVGNFQQN